MEFETFGDIMDYDEVSPDEYMKVLVEVSVLRTVNSVFYSNIYKPIIIVLFLRLHLAILMK